MAAAYEFFSMMIRGRVGCFMSSRITLKCFAIPGHHFSTPSRNIHHMLQLCSRKETEISSSLFSSRSPQTTSSPLEPEVDVLAEELQKSKTVDRVLELASLHGPIMNSKQLALTFKMIYEYLRDKNPSNAYALQQNKTFLKLCSRVQKCARFLDTESTMSVFRTLSLIGVSSETAVMQTVLQMLRHYINDLSLDQLTFLMYLLSKQHPTPVVEALKIAVPLVLQSQIDIQLRSEHMPQVVGCLAVAARYHLKEESIVKLVKCVLDHPSSLTPQLALNVSQSLLHLKHPVKGSEELFRLALDVLADNINQLKLDNMLSLFFLGLYKQKKFYHWRLFRAVASRILKEDVSLSFLYLSAQFFTEMEFVVEDLLKKLAEQLCSNPEIMNADDRFSVANVARIFSLIGYQPTEYDELWHLLVSSPKVHDLKAKAPDVFLDFMMYLAVLKVYPPNLLRETLSTDFMTTVISRSSEKGCLPQILTNLRYLSMGLGAEASTMATDLRVPPHIVKEATADAILTNRQRGFPMKEFLETALGGSAFVLTGVATKNGHVIDHAVVIRNGEYPVAVNLLEEESPEISPRFLEDIKMPPAAKIITITLLTSADYCRETGQLKGTTKLHLRTMRKLGYFPITVDLEAWNNLLDREKIPYIMREIKNICLSEEWLSGCE